MDMIGFTHACVRLKEQELASTIELRSRSDVRTSHIVCQGYEGSAPQYYLNWEANASTFFKDRTLILICFLSPGSEPSSGRRTKGRPS